LVRRIPQVEIVP